MNEKLMQVGVAEALLDAGIALPLWRIKLPWGKEWKLRFIMRRPTLGSQIRASRLFASIGITSEELEQMSKEETLGFVAQHGHTLSMIMALAICRGYLSGKWLAPIVAWILRWRTTPEVWLTASMAYVSMISTRPFEIIIRSMQMSNPLTPRLSQEKMGS